MFVIVVSGCAISSPSPQAGRSGLAVRAAPSLDPEHGAPLLAADRSPALAFRGRLGEGDPGELPASIKTALDPHSPVTFAYREELTHSEQHKSLLLTAFDPATYAGAPLGEYGVEAFASLIISRGDLLLGHYTARTFVSRSYSLYAEPTHRALDDAARREVRAQIDAQVFADAPRLAAAAR